MTSTLSSTERGEHTPGIVDLLPCPFCGGEAKRITLTKEDGHGNEGGDVIGCTLCGASSHVEFGRKENLVSRWNQRPEAADLISELVGALEPFAAVAEHDIGDDEADDDRFRPITHNHAPHLTVGDVRRARTAVAKARGGAA